MILRRITKAFRDHEWFLVAVELLIVVLGVFLGLQVNNWNEARLEDRQSIEFTERLKADLRIEAWNYEAMMAYLEDVQGNANDALAMLEGSLTGSNEDLLVNAYRATQYVEGVRRRATYDELTSTGSIGLIRDSFLRDMAAFVYTRAFIDRVSDEGLYAPYRIAFRKLLPVGVQDMLSQNCGDLFVAIGDFSAVDKQLDYECQTKLTKEQIDDAASLLRSDPEIIPLLRLQVVNLRTQISLFNFTNRDVMESLRAIAEQKS
jgi:hypothetical protein